MDVLYNDLFYSWLFLIVGFVLLFLEVFIPSGGILGVLATLSTGFGIWGLWYQGRTIFAIVGCVGYVAYGYFILRFIMKRISLFGSMSSDTSTSVDQRLEKSLVGKRGVAVTALRPAGMALIEGKKIDVVSTGGFIARDAAVTVVEISGNRVVVREFVTAREPETREASPQEPQAPVPEGGTAT